MIYLLIILLLFGLLQSLLELRKDDTKATKWRIKKLLSLLYIVGFIIAVIVTMIQEQSTKEVSRSLEGISASITKIDTIKERLAEVFLVQDSLLTQYYKINSKLAKQVELDKKSLEEKSPVIDLKSYDIKWDGNDSISYSIEACIRNYGGRNALITGGHGYGILWSR